MVAGMSTPAAARPMPTRQRLLWSALATVLAPVQGRSVLDCGGGSGSLAVPMAELGAEVTVVDVSVDALATLTRRSSEAGVSERIHPVQGDIESLADAVGSTTFDLVMAHELLESVDDVTGAFDSLASAVRPGGRLSIVVANPVAAVLSRVVANDFAAARALLKAPATGQLMLSGVEALCAMSGLSVDSAQGIGVFTEFAGSDDAEGVLAELEELASMRSPYRDIAARVHVVARRAG